MFAKAIRYYFNSYKGLSPEMWWLSLVILVNRSGTMVVPFMMLYLTGELHCTISQAGFVLGVFGVGAIIGTFMSGRFTVQLGYYNVQFFSLIGGGLLFILLGQLKNYNAICVCSFFLSVVNEAFRPANTTAVGAYSTPQNRTRSFSLNRLAINLGWALGGGLGGFIASFSYQWLFWIDGITNIGAAILLFIYLKPVAVKEEKPANDYNTFTPFRDKMFVSYWILGILFSACFFQLFSNITAFFKYEAHFSERYIGFLLAWNGIIIFLFEMVLIYWIEKNLRKGVSIALGMLFFAVSFALLVFFDIDPLIAMAFMTLVTLAEMFAFPVMNSFWVSRTNDQNRGHYAGINSMGWAIAQSTGPYLGSLVVHYSSFNTLWWVVIGISIGCAFFMYRLIKN